MSLWEDYDFERRIEEILRDTLSHEPEHHFGRPFLLPYQIAIEFRRRYPADYDRLGKPVGGRETGQQTSLSQYIGRELSERVKNHRLRNANIEGRFLSRLHLAELTFTDPGDPDRPVESSLTGSWDASMFRLRDGA